MNRVLYTYERELYWQYKSSNEDNGVEIVSVSNIRNNSDIEEVNRYHKIIDMSSISSMLKHNEDLVFQYESLLALTDETIEFIVDIKHASNILYEFRHVFSEIRTLAIEYISMEIDTQERPQGKEGNDMIIPRAKKITDLTNEEVASFHDTFDKSIYGHNEFKLTFQRLIKNFRVFNKIGEHKILSLFLMGHSGVGKTEVARSIFRALGGTRQLAKINFGNYSSHDALNSLIGSPLGYIGSDGGELIKRLYASDVGIILIDEFEKATYPVFNFFLDVLETGIITNNKADEYDVSGFIIVFTSNMPENEFSERLSPELRSRFDYKGIFDALSLNEKQKFVEFRLNSIIDKYNAASSKDIHKNIIHKILKRINCNNISNMRELNKLIQDYFVEETSNY